jgi:hypothetical protein
MNLTVNIRCENNGFYMNKTDIPLQCDQQTSCDFYINYAKQSGWNVTIIAGGPRPNDQGKISTLMCVNITEHKSEINRSNKLLVILAERRRKEKISKSTLEGNSMRLKNRLMISCMNVFVSHKIWYSNGYVTHLFH